MRWTYVYDQIFDCGACVGVTSKNDHLIDSRLSSKNSLFSDVHDTSVESSNVVTQPDNKSDQDNVCCKSYQSMIKLITGSLVLVGDDKYSKICCF